MVMGLIIVVHAIACVGLVFVVLIQSGRGGGLTEGFGGAESVFGAKTTEAMVKITTTLAVIFLVTSLVLAFMSARAEKSLMAGQGDVLDQLPAPEKTITIDIPVDAASPEAKPLAEAQPPQPQQ